MMLRILVVDGSPQRRDDIVDALCELPGIEVRAAAVDVTSALAQLDRVYFDIVIGASDLPSASIVTLIDAARRHGASRVIVMTERQPLLTGMVEYWQLLGAHDVVSTLPSLVARVTTLAASRGTQRPRRLAAAIVGNAHVHRALPVVSIADVLRKAIRGWGELIPPEVQLHLEATNDLPRVRCAPKDIEMIALDLVLDACRALPLGGSIWLIVERSGSRHVRIEVLDSSRGATSLEVTLPAVVNQAS